MIRRLICMWVCMGAITWISAQQGQIKFKKGEARSFALKTADGEGRFFFKKDRRHSDSQDRWILFGGMGGELRFDPGKKSGQMRVGQRLLQIEAFSDSIWQVAFPGDTMRIRTYRELLTRAVLFRPLKAVPGSDLHQPTTLPIISVIAYDSSLKKWNFEEEVPDLEPGLLLALLFVAGVVDQK